MITDKGEDMVIIDKEGRLFGKVNIFDLFVITTLACAAILAIQWVRLSKDPSWVQLETFNVRCIGVAQLPEYTAGLVREGDKILDIEKTPVGIIEKVISVEPVPAITYVSKDGEKIFYQQDIREVTILMSLIAYKRKGETYLAASSAPLKIGNVVALYTDNVTANAAIIKILQK
ncbi:MAG: DUF4330 domain-containing protein [Candidatus Omnitrophica bacterium]|nr:DUF4330 domain-containing protein [Candidatus Omnitrophota bacterium]